MKAPATQAAAATAAMLGAGALIAQQVSGKATRDALYLTHLDVRTLPYVMIAAAVVSLAAVVLFSREMVRRTPARAVPAAFAVSAAFLLAEWALSLRAPAAAALALYVHMAVFGAPLISGFWSLVNERFDPYTAKSVVGRIGAGATFGGVLGGAVTLGAADLVRASTMLPVLALLNLVTLWGLRALGGGSPPPLETGEETGPSGRLGTSAFRVLREVRYLRSLAVIIGLGAVAEGLLDFVLKAEADAAFQSGPDLMTFFAAFHTAVGALAFGVQALFSRPALERLGLAGTVALRPAAVATLGLAGVLYPRLLTATLARGAEAVLSHSLFRSGYELLYTPVPHARKRPAKALVDVGFDRLGMALGSLLVLAVLALAPAAATRALLALGTAAAVAALLMSRRVHSGYVGTLADSLRSGAVRLDPSDVMDSTTRLTLSGTAMGLNREQLLQQIQALSQSGRQAALTIETRISDLPATAPVAAADPFVRAVADLAGGDRARTRRVLAQDPLDPRLAPQIIPLLARDEVFGDALQALRRIAPKVTGQLLDALLDPEGDLVVRRRVPRVLKACATQRAADGLLAGLDDERFEVRYPCGLALSRITSRNPSLALSRRRVVAAALREIEGDRRMWEAGPGAAPGGDPGDRALEHVFTLLSLVLEREPMQMAYRALVSADQRLRGTALEYLENVLPDAVRDSLWFYLGVRERARRERPAPQVLDDLRRSMAAALGGSRRSGA